MTKIEAKCVMTATRCATSLAACALLAAAIFVPTVAARAQDSEQPARLVVVIGEGRVTVAPDHARIRSGVTTRAKTAKDAAEANTKAMNAIMTALVAAGVAKSDIQTAHFSIQPVYVAQQSEQKLSGYSVSNQLSVTIQSIDQVGEILDRLIAAGATDAGNIELLHSDTTKVLDDAREKAMADAKRKAELYAKAAGMNLGAVNWIAEDSSYAPPFAKMRALAAPAAAAVPIAAGEDTLEVRITVGFDLAH
jgi:uncharacterized protein